MLLYPVEFQEFIECTLGIYKCKYAKTPNYESYYLGVGKRIYEYSLHNFHILCPLKTADNWQVPAGMASFASQQIICFGQEFASETDRCIEYLHMFKAIR